MDTGVQLAKWGLHTVVMLSADESPVAEAVVISTDSRAETAAEAHLRAKEAARRLSGRTVYKKIDSTLRGNIGAELDGVLDGLGLQRALVAPAAPFAGRTTSDGYHRVHGVLLAESTFARDQLSPATESHLPTLLARQTRRTVGHLPVAVVERGEQAVIRALMAEPSAIVAADAVESRHLSTLALALVHMDERWLPCGSAGFAEEWARASGLRKPPQARLCWSPDARPVLVVAGSRHPATARQLRRAVADVDLHCIRLSPAEDEETKVHTAAVPLLRQGRHLALTTTFSEYQGEREVAVAAMLGRAALWVLAQAEVAGLVVTGGDTARALCRALAATAVHVLDEVQAGVPAGTLLGGPRNGMRVVSKAGGFGDELAIVQSIQSLQGRLT